VNFTFRKFYKISTALYRFIFQCGGAEPTNAPCGDRTDLNFSYAVIIQILLTKATIIKSSKAE